MNTLDDNGIPAYHGLLSVSFLVRREEREKLQIKRLLNVCVKGIDLVQRSGANFQTAAHIAAYSLTREDTGALR